MVFIYILKLEGGKYYVGKTINPEFRLESHFNARGSEWTKLYAPIKVHKVYSDCDAYDEDKYTIKYMAKYGERNVRGGSYCSVKLSDDELVEVAMQIDGAQDKCMSCGKPGHFIRDCPDRKRDKERKRKEKVKKANPAGMRKFPIRIQCDRCGRAGHLEEECYAETDKDGYEIALETGCECYIYILKLEGNKYYVGKTTNPSGRYKSHIESSGSSWTTKYPPIKQLKIIPNCDKYDEHKYTVKYMEKYGIDNVRGASYCRVKLTDEEKRDIKRQIDGAKDVCHKCGDTGHFAIGCSVFKSNDTCNMCGRLGHTEYNCTAETDFNGYKIVEMFDCRFCGKEFEDNEECTYHENIIGCYGGKKPQFNPDKTTREKRPRYLRRKLYNEHLKGIKGYW